MIVDRGLARRAEADRPILFGLFGAGFMAQGIVNQIRYLEGIECVAICNRSIDRAVRLVEEFSAREPAVVSSTAELDDSIESGRIAITDSPDVVSGSQSIECLVEATGHIDYGARATYAAIEGGKHVVLMNAELDATVGPLLKAKADDRGVVYTGCDGDQPAVQINLYRFVESIGLVPLVCGNIKGLQDRYRTPETQAAYAKQWGQTPSMVTSFADGTKISFEQAIVANATGMKVSERGMRGIEHDGHIDDLVDRYDVEELRAHGGIVDYVIGPRPSPGVYVFAEARDEVQELYLRYGKLGDGPLYSFYVPYHLTALEVTNSVVRAVEYRDAAIAPQGGLVVDVVAAAKRDIGEGETIDGLGGFMTYGLCENHEVVRDSGLLPMGLAEGSVATRQISKDEVISVQDVCYPGDTVIHGLREQQDALFAGWGRS